MKVGAKPTTKVEILKIKRGKPTVIQVFGDRYVLDPSTKPGDKRK